MTLTFGVSLTLMFLVALAGGILALVDGVIRARSRSGLGIAQVVVAALFTLSLVVRGLPLAIGDVEFTSPLLGLILALLLLAQLVLRGSTRRSGVALTVVALVLLVVWFVFGIGARVAIPGINA